MLTPTARSRSNRSGAIICSREASWGTDRASTAVVSSRSCTRAERELRSRRTLGALVAAMKAEGAGAWIDAFEKRYLGFERISALSR